jgi:hypothetical protein
MLIPGGRVLSPLRRWRWIVHTRVRGTSINILFSWWNQGLIVMMRIGGSLWGRHVQRTIFCGSEAHESFAPSLSTRDSSASSTSPATAAVAYQYRKEQKDTNSCNYGDQSCLRDFPNSALCLCGCPARCSSVARFRQHLECGKSIGTVHRCVDAENHSRLTMTGLATVSPYRLSIVDGDLECGEVTCDIGAHRIATEVA